MTWPRAINLQAFQSVSPAIAFLRDRALKPPTETWAAIVMFELCEMIGARELTLESVLAACEKLSATSRIYAPSLAEIVEEARDEVLPLT